MCGGYSVWLLLSRACDGMKWSWSLGVGQLESLGSGEAGLAMMKARHSPLPLGHPRKINGRIILTDGTSLHAKS